MATPPIPKPTVRREALVTLTLSAVAIVAFAVVLGLVTRFHDWQGALAERVYQQGERELQSGRAGSAIEDFRSALAFNHDSFLYQFRLAQALEAEDRFDEAESYLNSLWERQPQNGMVNLQLARLAAHRQLTGLALRYYHNAIYGIWDRDPDQNRRTARFELIQFLLKQNDRTQAQAELIAMEAGLPSDPQLHLKVAGLFLQIQDYQNALVQFRQVLQLEHKNAQAGAGAGEAAFDLGHYRTALHYLEIAVSANHKDEKSAQMLEMAGLVLDSNPFRRNLSLAERKRRIQNAFQTASARLASCMQAHGESTSSAQSSLQKLYIQETRLKPRLRRRALDDPDFQENVMDFVFDVEEETEDQCGSSTGLDQALLLLGRNREGVEL